MSRKHLGLILISGFMTGCQIGEESPEVLVERALHSTNTAEQEKAALELTDRGPSCIPQIRRLATESKTSSVRAAAIQALGAYDDKESASALFSAMEDPNPLVRGRAGVAMITILGADYHFAADDPLPKRQARIAVMRQSYEQLVAHNRSLKAK